MLLHKHAQAEMKATHYLFSHLVKQKWQQVERQQWAIDLQLGIFQQSVQYVSKNLRKLDKKLDIISKSVLKEELRRKKIQLRSDTAPKRHL